MPDGFKSDYIANYLGGESTDNDIYVDNLSSLSGSTKKSISFYNDPKFKDDLLSTKARIVILKKNDVDLRKGASIIVDDPYLAFAKLSNLLSGTATIPTLGSIVQKGKFAACALLEFVRALNNVDLPTFGKPTIPHLKLIIYYLLCLKINLILYLQE